MQIAIAAFWALLEVAFEVGQHPEISTSIVALLPEWFQMVPVLDHAAAYFSYGSFDSLDILATVLGAMAAYWTIRRTESPQERH